MSGLSAGVIIFIITENLIVSLKNQNQYSGVGQFFYKSSFSISFCALKKKTEVTRSPDQSPTQYVAEANPVFD